MYSNFRNVVDGVEERKTAKVLYLPEHKAFVQNYTLTVC
jgi:hypothetical protein